MLRKGGHTGRSKLNQRALRQASPSQYRQLAGVLQLAALNETL